MPIIAFINPEFTMLLFIPVIIAAYILFFLAIRGLVLWYFKINDVTRYHEEHLELMKRQNLLIEQQTELIKEFKMQMGGKNDEASQRPDLPNQI